MALANIAELLYRQGLNVLMVDFDLEAPGLESYFGAPEALISPKEILEKRGIIVVIIFVLPNQQNIDSARMMAQSLANPKLIQESRQGKPIAILPVPSRVERAEGGFQNDFRVQFEDCLGEFLSENLRFKKNAFDDFVIPHVPFYAYLEKVAAREPELSIASDMNAAYKNLAVALGQLEPEAAKKINNRKNIASVSEHEDGQRRQQRYEPFLKKQEIIETLQKELEQKQAMEFQLAEELNTRVHTNLSLEKQLVSVRAEKRELEEQAWVVKELQQQLVKVTVKNEKLEAQAQKMGVLKEQLANVTVQKQAIEKQAEADRKKLEGQAWRIAEDLKQRLANVTTEKQKLKQQTEADRKKLEKQARRTAEDMKQRLVNVTAEKEKFERQVAHAMFEGQAHAAKELKKWIAKVTVEKEKLEEQVRAEKKLKQNLTITIAEKDKKLAEQARAAEALKQRLANISHRFRLLSRKHKNS
ncbi:MAG: hypothetical protein GY862_21635 [Gammaproteobacteria bacterium]|nr:hypothetical protein [Gammaproteobacteria bacterium]